MADTEPTKRTLYLPVFVGQKFGFWTVISKAENFPGNLAAWLCRCKCGHEQRVRQNALNSAGSRGCRKCAHERHGMTHTREHISWAGMISRCTKPNDPAYPRYGGAGITVCDRWLIFENFYEDMGPRPPKYTLDRIDNSRGYSPDNCRWVGWATQARNKSVIRFYTYKGETLCLKDWGERFGISKCMMYYRLKRGMTLEQALTTPLNSTKRGNQT